MKVGDKVCTCLKGKEKQYPDLLAESPEDFECGHPSNVGIISEIVLPNFYLIDFPYHKSRKTGQWTKNQLHKPLCSTTKNRKEGCD